MHSTVKQLKVAPVQSFILQRPIAECNAGMCGDVNLYMNDPEDAHCGEIEASISPHSPRISVRT